MIIKSCLSCTFHEVKEDGKEKTSHCRKENCWSRYSKCILAKALEKYLKEQSFRLEYQTLFETFPLSLSK